MINIATAIANGGDKVLRGYIRPEPRYSEAKQRPMLLAAGVAKDCIYLEEERRRGDPFAILDAFIHALRPEAKDTVVVSDLHRLGSDGRGLRANIRRIKDKKATILEARTGRKSDDTSDLSDMIFDAVEFYRGRGLTHDEAVELGKRGAANSPASKPKEGRMPIREAKAIWLDLSLTVGQALAKINADTRYTTEYNQVYAYRKLGKRNAVAGRRPVVRKGQGCVYFVRINGAGPVKIGFTTNMKQRAIELSVAHHEPLTLCGVMDGTQEDERRLHREFRKYRVRGEWFKYAGPVAELVRSLPVPKAPLFRHRT